jgi:hypothetical protein
MWSERKIAAVLSTALFKRSCLVVVPNCGWTGSECDVLAVTKSLKVIDVEIKISRADLKADAKKDKWFHNWDWRIDGPWHGEPKKRRCEWPAKVWKHYYVLPAEIWKDDLFDCLGSPRSGVVTLSEKHGILRHAVVRHAAANRDAKPIAAEDAVNLGRLASLRMWEAYASVDRMSGELKHWRETEGLKDWHRDNS